MAQWRFGAPDQMEISANQSGFLPGEITKHDPQAHRLNLRGFYPVVPGIVPVVYISRWADNIPVVAVR